MADYDGERCPHCGSDEIEGHEIETGGGSATQEMSCSVCDATWNDLYRLVGHGEGITRCVYHSQVWDNLVETGWITMCTCQPHPTGGHRIAVMILEEYK
jgi:hypothetical protein